MTRWHYDPRPCAKFDIPDQDECLMPGVECFSDTDPVVLIAIGQHDFALECHSFSIDGHYRPERMGSSYGRAEDFAVINGFEGLGHNNAPNFRAKLAIESVDRWLQDDDAACARIRNNVTAERRIIGSTEFAGERHRCLDTEVQTQNFAREYLTLEQNFGCEYICLPFEKVGDLGVERLFAVVDQAVDLCLVGERAVTGFMEFDERLLGFRSVLVDYDKSIVGLK